MARDDVATEPVMGTQGFFKVDRANGRQTGGFAERFGRDVYRELLVRHVERGDRHARAVERNAVAKPSVVQLIRGAFDAESFARGCRLAQRRNGSDAADAGDDSCKHPPIVSE